MTRHDKEDVDDFIKEANYSVINYTDDNKTIEGFSNHKSIVAKIVKNEDSGFEKYIVKCYSAVLFDPQIKTLRYRRQDWRLRSVKKQVFDLYLQFLGYKNINNKYKTVFKIKAERLL